MEGYLKKYLVIIGLVLGIPSFLFVMGDTALSYSDNAKFCLNCHSMDDAYKTLQHSNHKQFKCTDCHAPKAYVPKVIFKTKSGLRDLYHTVTGDIPQVITPTEESRQIIKANCTRCHQTSVEKVKMGEGRYCTDCHRQVAHIKNQ